MNEEEMLSDMVVVNVDTAPIPNWKKIVSLIGFPVEEREYHTNVTPIFSFLFVSFCVICFVLGPTLTEMLMLNPKELFRFGGLNFLSYAFVHADIMHIVGNLFFIWPFMDNVEEHLGHASTMLLIIVSSVVASVIHILLDKSDLPLVGASGVCFCFATLYCLLYPKNRFLISVPLIGAFAYKIRLRLRARTLFFYYIAIEIFGGLSQSQGLTSVSHFGHLGGAAVGILFYVAHKEKIKS